MDRNSIVWVLECCLLSIEGYPKKDLEKFGCPEELIEIGIKLYAYLKNKEIKIEVKNGN